MSKATEPRGTPAAEVDISPGLVSELLAEQRPDLKDRQVRVLANGWDNVICLVGDDLLTRLPRRALAAALVLHEQRWLPVLAPRLPLAVPAPVHAGYPAGRYRWPWSITPFFPGQVAATTPLADPAAAAASLGAFLRALHVPAPADAPENPFRGMPLVQRRDTDIGNLTRAGHRVDAARVRELWAAAHAVPPWSGPAVWLHGDLHPANIVVNDDRLSAVIDFGDLTSGDPATDLSVAWMLFPAAAHREIFWDAYGQADAATRTRAMGWALSLSVVFLAHSADNPLMASIGERGYRAVVG